MSETDRNPPNPATARTLRRRKVAALILVTACLAGGVVAAILSGRESDLSLARRAMERSQWSEARRHLDSHLKRSPDDAAARLLMAEAFARDGRPGSDDIQQALRHLREIDDGSPLAATARVKEAKLTLLVLHRPAQAEALLRRAIRLDPDFLEAHFLLWRLFDLTERHSLTGPYFWRTYELAPREQQLVRLREWFLSEFFIDSSCREFDQVMNVPQRPAVPINVSRLLMFREAEPGAAFVHAGIASHFLQAGEPEFALTMLKKAPDLSKAMQDPHFVSVLFHSLLDLGEFEKAKACFQRWPAPHSGYDYWRAAGLFEETIDKDHAAAIEYYRQARNSWLGVLDWKMLRRMAACLRRIGQPDEADRIHGDSVRFEHYVMIDRIKALRQDLSRLDDPAVLKRAASFYATIGLMREAEAWGEHHRRRLQSKSR